jgi:apolipoprotein N-acyltransferase
MNKIESNSGFGLAAFSLVLLVAALMLILITGIMVVGVILAAFALILSIAALVEARRSNGAVRIALLSLVAATLGTLLAIYLAGGIEPSGIYKANGTKIDVFQPDTATTAAGDEFTDLEKKLEELECDSAHQENE